MHNPTRRGFLAGWLFLLVSLGLMSCGEPREAGFSDDQLRIVSLAPAITHTLNEIGLRDAIVAVGEGDELAALGTPSLGRYVDLDLERLATLAPTHVLAMTGQAGLPEGVNRMAGQGRFVLVDLAYPGGVESSIGFIDEVGAAIDREDRTSPLTQGMRERLAAIAELTAERERPRALMVFNLERVMASGPNTVNDALLQIAGGENAASEATVTAPVYDREALRALAPEVIFLLMPGEPPLDGADDPRLSGLRGLGIPAVENERVYLLNDPAVLIPGPSMVYTAVSMAVALHPDLAEPIAEVFRDHP
ncbi:ABC transporter substrate-binding protein [Algisphaera agarilytica]|uniref:ABC-type Fe3+-hydroxamate transport system substrate-binding protein n=1 Tax=Algisphaera agarilytica TaxID=1385975 RepID=A0A7X0H8S7_9BACT|nr:ABC transporter substrate-binding protein [Algisphaera agarilytica]MBB6431233.1 ABC-type Fe3+-hydroxamate transport system substrate-binding protein [Algisphaera agarilytica]